jgi:transcription initiation factor TFIIB
MFQDGIVKCSECNSRELEKDSIRGDLLCLNCGLILAENEIDLGPDWTNFTGEEGGDKSHVGLPATNLLHDKGLSTNLGWNNVDYAGSPISQKSRTQMYRMRKWQQRARSQGVKERSMSIGFIEIQRMSDKLQLPKSVKEEACSVYKKALVADLMRGRSIDAVSASSLYIACRLCGLPRTLIEIAKVSRCGSKEVGRTERFIIRKLRMRLPLIRPINFIARFCSELSLPPATELFARQLCERMTEIEMDSGRGPSGMAAAALYIAGLATESRRTQQDIAIVTGVTEVTIRNRYKEMKEVLNIDVEP